MMIDITINIPSLDRLCAWLENRDKSDLLGQIETEIIAKLKEAAESGVPRPTFKEVEPADDHPWKDEAKPAPELEKPAPEPEKPAPEKPAPTGATLADVQQACARLRDAGKMNDVKALFPEFGIKKLSDLKGAEQLAAFAARLKKLEG
ncbi:MAG: hypothetical protein IKD53_04515 [Clostridia bacterium]|nr:hypothetical protein [Clostridia bacterium]